MPLQQPCDHDAAEGVKVEDMMLLVETLVENVSADDKQVYLYISDIYQHLVLCSEVLLLVLPEAQESHSIHPGFHGVSFPEAV